MAAIGNGASSEPLVLKNECGDSKSPYVQSHASNPVAWQLWAPESIALAKTHNRLLFLSIGYSACHWCHVMARESFSNPAVAKILNANFIPIKLDREERPDIDAIYMNYVQATTGSGGWPLNVFLTPDLEPVFGGTYFPPPATRMSANMEATSFVDIVEQLRDLWSTQRERCIATAKDITKQLREFAEEGVHSNAYDDTTSRPSSPSATIPDLDLLEEAYQAFSRQYDPTYGGFSAAPKFPVPPKLKFLLSLTTAPEAIRAVVGEEEVENASRMALTTLRNLARSGVRDQIGNGFARYSVTPDWTLPHFEKMLYDNAQLLDVYVDAWKVSHDPEILGAVMDLVNYLSSGSMVREKGGIYASEDADSVPAGSTVHGEHDKREGAYYVWTHKELLNVLGERDGDVCARFYGIQSNGNIPQEYDPHDEFVGQNVPRIARVPSQLAKELGIEEPVVVQALKEGKKKLREWRETHRPRPGVDDKIVAAWNGLAVGALAKASIALREIDFEKSEKALAQAKRTAQLIKEEMWDASTGILYRVWRDGKGAKGVVDDYAAVASGLLELYHATTETKWLRWADEITKAQLKQFFDYTKGGFFTAPIAASSPPNSSATSSSTTKATPTTTAAAPTSPSAKYSTSTHIVSNPYNPTLTINPKTYPAPHSHPDPIQPIQSTSSPSDILLPLKSGMDTSEPSPNALSALTLFTLSTLLNDPSYERLARQTVLAFEAEMEHWPGAFPGLMCGVGWMQKASMAGAASGERIGLSSVMVEIGGEGSGEKEREVRIRLEGIGGMGWGRSVLWVKRDGDEDGEWLRERNELCREWRPKGEGVRIMVCEGKVCREGGVELL